MKKDNKISIKIKGGGLSYNKKIDEVTAGRILALCLSQQESLEKTGGSKESVVEYISRYAPRRNPDKILTLARYLKDSQEKDSFHPYEIKNLFRDAAEILPANFVRDFRWAVRNGWIAPDHKKKGNYYVTTTGSKVLNEGFPKELIKITKQKGGKRHKRKK